jgi:hypothetical protein
LWVRRIPERGGGERERKEENEAVQEGFDGDLASRVD